MGVGERCVGIKGWERSTQVRRLRVIGSSVVREAEQCRRLGAGTQGSYRRKVREGSGRGRPDGSGGRVMLYMCWSDMGWKKKDRLPTLFESLLGVDDLILVLLLLLFLLSLLLGLFGGGGGLLSLGLGGGLLSALGSRGSLQQELTVSMLVVPLPRVRVPPPWL